MRRDPEQKTWLPNYLCRGHCRGKSVMGKRVSRDEHLNTGELVGKPSCMSETPVTCLQSFLCCGSPCGSHHRNSFRKAFVLGVTSTWKSISNECHECINCMYTYLKPASSTLSITAQVGPRGKPLVSKLNWHYFWRRLVLLFCLDRKLVSEEYPSINEQYLVEQAVHTQ